MQKKGQNEEFSDFTLPDIFKGDYAEFQADLEAYMKSLKSEMKKNPKEVDIPVDIIQLYFERCRYYHIYCEEDLHEATNLEEIHSVFKTKEKFLKTVGFKDKAFSELRFTSRMKNVILNS